MTRLTCFEKWLLFTYRRSLISLRLNLICFYIVINDPIKVILFPNGRWIHLQKLPFVIMCKRVGGEQGLCCIHEGVTEPEKLKTEEQQWILREDGSPHVPMDEFLGPSHTGVNRKKSKSGTPKELTFLKNHIETEIEIKQMYFATQSLYYTAWFNEIWKLREFHSNDPNGWRICMLRKLYLFLCTFLIQCCLISRQEMSVKHFRSWCFTNEGQIWYIVLTMRENNSTVQGYVIMCI